MNNLIKEWNSDILLYLKYLPKALENRKIDLIVFDQALVGISTLTDFLKIPSIEICNALAIVPNELLFHPVHTAPFPDFTYNPIKVLANSIKAFQSGQEFYNDLVVELNNFRKKNGMSKIILNYQIFSNNSKLTLAQLIPELDYPNIFANNKFHFLGSFSFEPSAKLESNYNLNEIKKPIIYATLGTLQNNNLHILQKIDKACAELDVQLVITLGIYHSDFNSTKSLFRKETIVYDFVPQQQLMQQASLTIIHAGLNSTMESLCLGKPMVCIPITHEQPIIAARMKRVKVAEVIGLEELSTALISKTILKIISDHSYTTRAEYYGELVRNAGGIEKAADLIEQVLID